MKRIKLTAFLILATFMNQKVEAVSLEFKFDVNSSGPSMYACNAGIRHVPHAEQICYERDSGESCDPSVDCELEEDCNCVCTGQGEQGGETRLDYLSVSYSEWKDNGEPATEFGQRNIFSPEEGFSRVFEESNLNEWKHQLAKMSVNLGSERYGAEFFLDICYRGPQIEYYAAVEEMGNGNPNNLGIPKFFLNAQATVNDLISANGLKYSELADLQVKTEVVCDQQGKGEFKYAGTAHPAGDTQYDTLAMEIMGMITSGGQYQVEIPYRDFNTNQQAYLISEFINDKKENTPRFCKVRYTFLENRRNDENLLAQLRKWKLQKAQVCTLTEIKEKGSP